MSIAIPTYNRLNYLKECINSILNQTFQDFSIFVFDNASDQPVEEELKKFNDKRIHFIGNDKNIGNAENTNRIFSYPFQSEYLIIFHDDDLMHPRMLELQTSFLDAPPHDQCAEKARQILLPAPMRGEADKGVILWCGREKHQTRSRVCWSLWSTRHSLTER